VSLCVALPWLLLQNYGVGVGGLTAPPGMYKPTALLITGWDDEETEVGGRHCCYVYALKAESAEQGGPRLQCRAGDEHHSMHKAVPTVHSRCGRAVAGRLLCSAELPLGR